MNLLRHLYHYFYLVGILLFGLIVLNYDMVESGLGLGLLGTDDSAYYYLAPTYDYLDIDTWFQVKNVGYYFINDIFYGLFFGDLLAVKVFNCCFFSICLWFYFFSLYDRDEAKESILRFGYFFVAFFPVLLILSLNYKDSFLFSLALLFMGGLQSGGRRGRVFRAVICFFAVVASEFVRGGAGALLLLCAAAYRLSFKYGLVSSSGLKTCFKLFVLLFVTFLFCAGGVEFVVSDLLGRSIEKYRDIFSGRHIALTGIELLDITVIGVLKSIFQFNYVTASNFASGNIGEHGYATPLFFFLYFLFVTIWPFALFAMVRRLNEKTALLYIYMVSNVLLFSYFYYGLIGLRMSFILVSTVLISIASPNPSRLAVRRSLGVRYIEEPRPPAAAVGNVHVRESS